MLGESLPIPAQRAATRANTTVAESPGGSSQARESAPVGRLPKGPAE